jgi:hypothetical protein
VPYKGRWGLEGTRYISNGIAGSTLSAILSENLRGIEHPALLLAEAAGSSGTIQFRLLNVLLAFSDFVPESFVGSLQPGELLLKGFLGLFVFADFVLELPDQLLEVLPLFCGLLPALLLSIVC